MFIAGFQFMHDCATALVEQRRSALLRLNRLAKAIIISPIGLVCGRIED
jgi:hypothetical protein